MGGPYQYLHRDSFFISLSGHEQRRTQLSSGRDSKGTLETFPLVLECPKPGSHGADTGSEGESAGAPESNHLWMALGCLGASIKYTKIRIKHK